MKTDKELLELAARAIGYDTNHPMNTERCNLAVPIDDLWVTCDGNLVSTGWNPLKDDGHALRLAVKREMDVTHYQNSVEVTVWIDGELFDFISEEIADCRISATRRAIVRAAAAIGEKL